MTALGLAIAPLLVSLVLICMPVQAANANEALMTLARPKPLPDFSLHDHGGRAFGLADLKGRWSLMFLGFTSCPDVCPMTLMKLEAVRAELGLRFMPERVPDIYFLAVDPDRDTPVLADYLAHFHPDNIGLTGDHEQIQRLVKGLDGFYRLNKPKPGATYYDVTHTAAIAVINPRGEVVAKLNPPLSIHPIGEFLTQLIRRGGQ